MMSLLFDAARQSPMVRRRAEFVDVVLRAQSRIRSRPPGVARLARRPHVSHVVSCLMLAFVALCMASPLPAQVRDTGEAAEAGAPAPAESPDARGTQDDDWGSLHVYLLTMGPGDAVWERFGHNAILLRDPARGIDVAYNYGMFSFDQPGFVGRLMKGRMLYWMAPLDGTRMLREYQLRNRTVWAQELALAPGQKYELARFLEWNAQPENAEYLYEPFRDNCSTRIRDALNRVLGGQLQNALDADTTTETFRSHSLRLLADDAAPHAGLLLALGQPTDRPLTEWDAAFIPMELRTAVNALEVRYLDGTTGPLVLAEEVWHQAMREPEPAEAPSRLFVFLGVGVAFALLFLGLGHIAARTRAARVALAVIAFLWSALVGVLGAIIGSLWAFTDHTSTWANENLFTVNPIWLVVAILLLPALLTRRAQHAAAIVTGVGALIGVIGVVLQVLPSFYQQNGEILAATVPAQVALAVVMLLWERHASSVDPMPGDALG